MNNFTDVLFFDKFHIAVGFGASYFSLGEAAGTLKDKFHAVLSSDRFDFNFVGDTRKITNDFLKVIRRAREQSETEIQSFTRMSF